MPIIDLKWLLAKAKTVFCVIFEETKNKLVSLKNIFIIKKNSSNEFHQFVSVACIRLE